jgi:hypothetical protein
VKGKETGAETAAVAADQPGRLPTAQITAAEPSLPDPDDFVELRAFVEAHLSRDRRTVEEIRLKELQLLRQLQGEYFQLDLDACGHKGGRALRRHGPLRGRLLFVDQNGILHVMTRLAYAKFLPWAQKNPIALPRRSALPRLVSKDAHRKAKHRGAKATPQSSVNYQLATVNCQLACQEYRERQPTVCRRIIKIVAS